MTLRGITESMGAEERLAGSEARLRGILDSAMDAIITVDETQHIVLFNAAAEAVFGCPRADAIGAPLARFIPQRFRAQHETHIRTFGEAGTSSRRMGAQRIVTALRRNGEEFPIDASISQVEEGGRKFYTVILRDVTERVRADAALRDSQRELRELAEMSQSAREQEKTRVARELHDELAQALTALKMDLEWFAERLPKGPPALTEKIAKMQAMLDATVAATRRISADLRPLMLDDLGLAAAVEWLIDTFKERNAIACDLEIAGGDLDLSEPYASCVFRILQEALTNVARHSRASRVRIAVERAGGEIVLTVADNGRGFALDEPRKPSSFGLLGLRERVYLVRGKVRIDSAPGKGVSIEVRIPLEPAETSP